MIIIENNYDHYELLVTLKKSHDNSYLLYMYTYIMKLVRIQYGFPNM